MTSVRKEPASRGSLVWVGVVVVVVVLGIIAVVAARGSNKDTSPGRGGALELGTKTCATSKATLAKGQPLPRFATSADDAARCEAIPSLKGNNLDGDAMTIKAGGQAKLILFVAHWCPHCQREIPLLKGYLDDNPLPKGVELLTVSTDIQPDAPNFPPKAWLDREGWTAPTLDDTSSVAAGAYGLSTFPYFVVADRSGKVLWRTTGELSTDDFATLVESARTGKIPV